MADVQALLKDCRIKGTIIITVGPDDGKQITYGFSADGMGNIIGTWESDYQYDQDTRMKFSILRDASAEGQWRHDYVIGVLANLEGADDDMCARKFESKTGMPEGATAVEPISVDEAVSEGHSEYTNRQKQYQRLGIDGCDPGKVFIHSMRREPHSDIELFISEADEAFCSLQMMILLSPGFLLSDIYGNIADGLDDGGLSLTGWRRNPLGLGVESDYDDKTEEQSENDTYSQPESSEVSDEFDGINWNDAIDDQAGALASSSDRLEPASDDGNTATAGDCGENEDQAPLSLSKPAEENHTSNESEIMIQDGGDPGDDSAEEDDSAYDSIIAGSDDGDEFDMDQMDQETMPAAEAHDDADDADKPDSEDRDHAAQEHESGSLLNPPVPAAVDENQGPSANVRDDVHEFMDRKLESITASLEDYERKISEAAKERDAIVDESASLVSLSQSITEEKAKLESMKERKSELEQSIKEAARKRSELDDKVKSYTAGKQSLEQDRVWLQSLRQR